MKRLYRIIFIFITIFLLLIVFLPKVNLYYALEHQLKKDNIIIDNEQLEPLAFGFNIKGIDLWVKSIQSAYIKNISIQAYWVYQSIDITKIKLSANFKGILPLNIKKIKIVYTVLNPLNITIKAKGDFGILSGKISILDSKLLLAIRPSSLMRNQYKSYLRQLKKINKGEYRYEYHF